MDTPPLEHAVGRRPDPRPARSLGRRLVASALSDRAGAVRMVAVVIFDDAESPDAHVRRSCGHSRRLAPAETLSRRVTAAPRGAPCAPDRKPGGGTPARRGPTPVAGTHTETCSGRDRRIVPPDLVTGERPRQTPHRTLLACSHAFDAAPAMMRLDSVLSPHPTAPDASALLDTPKAHP